MKYYSRKTLFLILFLSPCLLTIAQKEVALEATGKINTSNDWIYKRVNATKGIKKTIAVSINKSLSEQLEISYKPPTLHPPTGFGGKYTFLINLPGPFSDLLAPTTQITMQLSYMYKDKKTGAVKPGDFGYSGIVIQSNGLEEIYNQQGNFWKECDKLKLPVFFEQLSVTDSTADYIEIGRENALDIYDVTNDPVRFIKRNNRPLFIPLTRKEYLEFLVAEKKYGIKDYENIIKDQQKYILEAKRSISDPANHAVKDALSSSIKTMEENIAKSNETIKTFQEKISQYRNLIKSMSAEEAGAPARFDANRKADEFYGLEKLVPYGRHEGTMLCRINPGYYDKSPGAPVVQLVVVSYVIPYSGLASPSYLGKKTVDIFRELDYHGLKESLQ